MKRAQEVKCLGAVAPGQEFEVVSSLLEGVDRASAKPRLGAGRRWRCDYSGGAALLLTDFDGHTIQISHDDARFVRVRVIERAH